VWYHDGMVTRRKCIKKGHLTSVRSFSPMDGKNPWDRTEPDHGPVYFSVVVAQIWGYSGCRLPHFKNHSKPFKDWLKSVATG